MPWSEIKGDIGAQKNNSRPWREARVYRNVDVICRLAKDHIAYSSAKAVSSCTTWRIYFLA
jgi:hypothetical protein